jgi:hypothetical protein
LFVANSAAVAKSLSKESITKAALFLSILLYNFSIEGISALQGGHQLAQRFTNIFFP